MHDQALHHQARTHTVNKFEEGHIACALLVWCRLKELSYQTGRTVYQIKHGQLSQYLIQQLKSPLVKMALA